MFRNYYFFVKKSLIHFICAFSFIITIFLLWIFSIWMCNLIYIFLNLFFWLAIIITIFASFFQFFDSLKTSIIKRANDVFMFFLNTLLKVLYSINLWFFLLRLKTFIYYMFLFIAIITDFFILKIIVLFAYSSQK